MGKTRYGCVFKMRVAVFANPTIGNIMGASDYVEFREACEFIVDKYKDAYFHFCLPNRVRGQATDKIERVSFHFYDDSSMLFYEGQACAPASFIEMFHSRIGRYCIDGVWTTRTTVAATLGRQLQDFRAELYSIPIVIEEFKAIDFEEAQQHCSEADLASNCIAYLLGYPMFDTYHEKDTAMRACARYLSGYSLEIIEERSTVVHCGINFEYIEKYAKSARKNEYFSVLFGGRMNAAKKTDWIFDCVDWHMKAGSDMRFVICTPTVSQTKAEQFREAYPMFEFNFSVPKNEFLEKASCCHAFVNASPSEGFSVGVVEQLYIGLVGVLPDRAWVKGLLMEEFERYPFIYKDRADMFVKLKWVKENYEEAKKALIPIQEMIRKRYSRRESSHATWEYIKKACDENTHATLSRIGRQTVELVKETTMIMPRRFSLENFCKNIVERSRVLRMDDFDHPGRGKPSRLMIYKWLCHNGYRDMLDSPAPWFEKI